MDSNLLFSRGNTSTDDNDVWDDTALIRAYDKAVNKIKTDLNKTSEKKSHKSEKNKKKESSSGGMKSERSQIKVKPTKWKIGDKCIGIYSEDNISYPAVIIDINNDEQTCRIRYDFYENEEDKALDELLEPAEEVGVQKKEKKAPKQTKDEQVKQEQKFQPLDFPIPPPPPPLPASLMSHFNNLTLNEDECGNQVEDKEAFYSMLMSWYMSGYHTGYYFGLTQRQFSTQ
jgi:survival motor neuron protein